MDFSVRYLMGDMGGDKRIPMGNITAVRLNEPGLTSGYLQLSLLGGQESWMRGVQDIGRDEDTVIFSKRHLPEFLVVKGLIESKIAAGLKGSPPPTSPSGVGIADEPAKLAQLRDSGVLSDDEFAAQKGKLLGS